VVSGQVGDPEPDIVASDTGEKSSAVGDLFFFHIHGFNRPLFIHSRHKKSILTEAGAGIEDALLPIPVVAPFTDFFFNMPGTEEKNIQEFIKKDPEKRGFIEEFSQGFFNGIVLHKL
jgi:hypothetical protein